MLIYHFKWSNFGAYNFHLIRLFLLFFMLPLGLVAQSNNKQDSILYIRDICFNGNKITLPKIMYREMNINIGDRILGSELDAVLRFNKRRLLNLQLFSNVEYNIVAKSNDSIDIEFNVSEIFYWIPKPIFSLADRNFNVWWYEQNNRLDRTNIGLELTRMNFRGRNERIGGTIQLGYNKFFDLFYKIPYIDKNFKSGLGLSATYQTGREINYVTDSNKLVFFRSEEYPYRYFQTEFTYTYRPAYALIHEFNLSYNYINITQALFNKNPEMLNHKKRINFFELKYTLKYNNTDIRIYPINGIETKLIITKKGLGLDKDINQFSAYAEASYYKHLWQGLSGALSFKGRFMYTKDAHYYFNRALGFKSQYLRGYEYYVIDGDHYCMLRSNLRFKIIDKTIKQPYIKFMKYIPIRIYTKLYDDIGYVHNKDAGNSFLNNKILHGYGMGIDLIVSYYAKFRLEYSFNHLGQNDLFLHSTKE